MKWWFVKYAHYERKPLEELHYILKSTMTQNISDSIKMRVWWSDFAGRLCHHLLALMSSHRPGFSQFSLLFSISTVSFGYPRVKLLTVTTNTEWGTFVKVECLGKMPLWGERGRAGSCTRCCLPSCHWWGQGTQYHQDNMNLPSNLFASQLQTVLALGVLSLNDLLLEYYWISHIANLIRIVRKTYPDMDITENCSHLSVQMIILI